MQFVYFVPRSTSGLRSGIPGYVVFHNDRECVLARPRFSISWLTGFVRVTPPQSAWVVGASRIRTSARTALQLTPWRTRPPDLWYADCGVAQ
jgi:hypothetical protein